MEDKRASLTKPGFSDGTAQLYCNPTAQDTAQDWNGSLNGEKCGDLDWDNEMIGGRGESVPYQVQLCVGRNAQTGEVRRLIKCQAMRSDSNATQPAQNQGHRAQTARHPAQECHSVSF